MKVRIGILDIDSQMKRDNRGIKRKYPNIACGKIYGYHKAQGHEVIYPWNGQRVDRLYISTIFTNSRPAILRQMQIYETLAKEVWIGGTGWDDYSKKPYKITKLPPEIEGFDDPQSTYEMYDIDYGIGFSTRGCHVGCSFCVVPKKEGLKEYRDMPVERLINPRSKHLVLMNNNSFAHHDFMEDIEQIKHYGLSIHWDQANDITLVTPDIAKGLSEVNYRSFDGKHKELFFAFDLLKKRKRIDLETAATPVLDEIGFKRYDGFIISPDGTKIAAHKGPNETKITVEYDMLKVIPEKVGLLTEYGIKPKHLRFYMLIGYNSTEEEDLQRVECLKSLGCEIYPMVYRDLTGRIGVDGSGKPQSPHVRALRDWLNPKTGLYRTQPFEQFTRRALRFQQCEEAERQLLLF